MKKTFISILLLAAMAFSAQAALVFNETFSYPNGVLTTVSGGVWANFGGTAGQLNVAANRAHLDQAESEDVQRGIPTFTSGTIYYSFVLNVTTPPPTTNAGNFIVFLKDQLVTAPPNLRAKVFVTPIGAAAGKYRVGVANGPTTISATGSAIIPTDLVPGTSYVLVVCYSQAVGALPHTTLWINPCSPNDTANRADATDQTFSPPLNAIALSQSLGIGVLDIDTLKVAPTFPEVGGDTTPPTITCPANITVPATSAAGAIVTFAPTAGDNTDPTPSITCVPPSGSTFPIGTTLVTCRALDDCGNGASCEFQVTVVRRVIEVDAMPFGLAQLTLAKGNSTEVVTLAGPTTVNVYFEGEKEGDATDDDGNGRDEVQSEMVAMDLRGTSSMGPVQVVLDRTQRSLGQIEETANATRGKLDVPPFTAGGSADSFFDVFVEIRVGAGATAMVLHPARPLHMQGVIKHKPPGPGDTYVNPFTDPVPLLDANGNDTGIRIIREVHTPNPEQERDSFTYTQGKINLRNPNGQIERVIVAGPTEVLVNIPPNGAAADTDGNGLEEVPMEMISLSLAGNSSLGPVMVMLDTARCRGFGKIEEKVNNTPGILDLPPFTATGGANSSFDLCLKIMVNGKIFRPCNNVLVHIESMISHKPPGPGEAYMNLIDQEIPLCDENGIPTGYVLTGEMHTPNIPKEIDFFPNTVAQLTVQLPNGGTEVVTLNGPTRVEVIIDDTPGPGFGLAADTDGDGFDQVPTEMTQLSLSGNSSLGPVQVSLRNDRRSMGEIEETGNVVPGVLEVPPFAPGTANSFFDIWPQITVAGQTYHTATPLHMAAVIRHKPPAPGDEYVNPFTQPVELLDAAGNHTGIFVVREVHTPNPDCTVRITCPPDMKVGAIVAAGVVVNYAAPVATGTCPPITVVCTPPSGSVFPIGTTTVTCVATDRAGVSATCSFRVTVFRRFVEVDKMPYGTAQLTLNRPGAASEVVTLAGPTTVEVYFDGEQEGDADDSDGDGLDDVPSRMTEMDLRGNSSMGTVRVTLDPDRPSLGGMEEQANMTTGRLDVAPFAAAGAVDSFFDVFTEIRVAGRLFRPAKPLHMASVIRHKPPAPGDTYVNPFTDPIELLDENGGPTGIFVVREVHTPNPEKEIDVMTYGTAQLSLKLPNGQTEVVTLAGPTTVEVDIAPNGAAADTDGDGLDQVPTRMTAMHLAGNSSQGPVVVTLDPTRMTLGEIEETANTQNGRLDVPPFAPNGTANSFFDVFAVVQVGAQTYHTAGPLRMSSVIRHKPPAPGDTYVNPFTQPVELLNAAGQPTGIFVVREVHTPNPEKEIDRFPLTTADITIQLATGGTEVVHLTGPTTVEVDIAPDGGAADTDGDGRDQVPTHMTELNLSGPSSIGPVQITLTEGSPTFGEIEEQLNNTPGKLDVPPFTATGMADSFFDVFVDVRIAGMALHNRVPLRMASVIRHKPPAPGDEYVNPFTQPVELLDANGNPTGIRIIREVHTPNPDCTVRITCPPDMKVGAIVAAGVVVNYPAPVATGTCPPITVVCTPPSGSVFPIGTTTVTCVATDRAGVSATCSFRVTVFRRFVEVDKMPYGTAQLTLNRPGAASEVVTLAGPTTVEVYFDGEQEGDADDSDGDGLDDVSSRMTEMDLRGNSSMGTVRVTLDPDRPSLGGMEEQANLTTGRLDVAPFAAAGTVDSFFDVFAVVQVGGQTYHTAAPLHMASIIRHKPPAPGDTYINPFTQPVELLDAAGRPTGIFVVREVHTPNPEKEIDVMDYGLAQFTLRLPNNATEDVTLAGSTTVEVAIAPNGAAADTDGDNRDQVPTRMTAMDLRGTSSFGPVQMVLDPTRPTVGEIEETANATPGTLDVPPFAAGGTADSFFDVFVEIHVGNAVYRPASALHMSSVIRHKPPAPGDTYVNPFTQPVELLDAAGRPTGIFIVREVHTPNPEQERDSFTYTQGKINIRHPNGQIERVIVAGPTEVLVDIPPNGAAADTDGNGLDQVPMEMTGLSLTGNSSLGPVMVMLDTARCRSFGKIEEKVNNTPGTLDLPPFTTAGGANSSFDLCLKIVVNGKIFRPCNNVLVHIESMISHKPPGPGEAYMNLINQEIPLCDENGNPTGIVLTGEMHTPNIPKEIDNFPNTVAQLTVRLPNNAEEVVTLNGPTRVEVCINDADGLAADTDGDGFDQVPTKMTLLNLTGNSSLGPVQVSLRADRMSLGEIEEMANLLPGVLEVPPFGPGTANSFFDIWPQITVAGQTYHTATPLHMAAVIRHKPPAPGDEYVNPFTQPVELLDAAGNRTGIFVVREVHTPDPNCQVGIQCPSNIVVWTCSANGLAVNYPPPTATSTCNLHLDINCVPPSGSNFAPGNNPVVCTARDPLGHTASCTFQVRVIRDTTPPQIVCPGDMKFDTCFEREQVFYAVTATDDCDTNVTIVCNPPSGSSFPAGTTPVNCRATDDCGHSSECRFLVTVTRLPEPSLTFRPLRDGRVVICWSSPCDNYVLQCTRSLNTPILWETIPGPYPGTAAQHCITNSPNGSHQFYRLKKTGTNEVFEPVGTFPPQGAYLSPSDETTVILSSPTPGAPPRRVLARWFVHPIPVPPIVVPRPPPCLTCPPDIHRFETDLDFEISLNEGESWVSVHPEPKRSVALAVQVTPTPDDGMMPGVRSFNTEILQLDGRFMLQGGIGAAAAGPTLLLRESPTKQSLGKTRQRQLEDGTFRVQSFFDVFIEVSLDGGQTWSPTQTPVHMELSPRAPTVAEAKDALPPAGSYDSPSGHITRYGNVLLARRIIHPVPPNPPLPFPPKPNPPCLTCPPADYRFTTDIRFEVSTDGGQTWAGVGGEASVGVRARLGRQLAGMRFFDTEMLQLDIHGGGGVGLPNMIMLRESPTLKSTGKTSIRESPSLSQPYTVESFFDIFTELSIDGGQTWLPATEPTHVELQPMLLP